MTTLQRSSYSFRRQGSSGRIWEHLPGGGGQPTATAHGNTQQQRQVQFNDGHTSIPRIATTPVGTETNQNPYASGPPSRSEAKPPRCSFISIFGRCAKVPAS